MARTSTGASSRAAAVSAAARGTNATWLPRVKLLEGGVHDGRWQRRPSRIGPHQLVSVQVPHRLVVNATSEAWMVTTAGPDSLPLARISSKLPLVPLDRCQ